MSLFDLQDVCIAIGSIATLDLPMVVDLIGIYTKRILGVRLPKKTTEADEGVSFLVVDRIGDFYRNLPRRADVIVTTVGARHKCQQELSRVKYSEIQILLSG
ncbi:DNA-directed RNA polymerase V subunit 1 [Dorcoceras hygrometricum]|uniref:DNA-directed RNA polymerase V subunit 1 n=1 Tax=Dorcoceras hygrometricum TaxID=472368 RepID=A0A2Z7BDH4_9LAMI|nr:DNA-directed RNA polymerase V subunit 1 [Dorcoceras hygrometricum]